MFYPEARSETEIAANKEKSQMTNIVLVLILTLGGEDNSWILDGPFTMEDCQQRIVELWPAYSLMRADYQLVCEDISGN